MPDRLFSQSYKIWQNPEYNLEILHGLHKRATLKNPKTSDEVML